MSDAQWWGEVFDLVGHLTVALIGLAIMGMAWRAPENGSMPLVLTKKDRERDDGIRNVRQVLLLFFGGALIVIGVWGLT